MNAVAIVIPVVAIVGALTMIIFLRYYENIERMSMIEKGLDPFVNRKRRSISPDNTLRFGLLLVGAGIGLLIGSILGDSFNDGFRISMIMIFGGAGLLLSYMIQKNNDKKENQ
ncbi:MAG: DUF6249 domain-containing protein [Spirosomataceae bacterium]